MTVFRVDTVATQVAGFSVTGVKKIFTLATIPDEVQPRDCPCILPDVVSGFATGGPITDVSYGGDALSTGRLRDVVYRVTYLLCHTPAGAGRSNTIGSAHSSSTSIAVCCQNFLAAAMADSTLGGNVVTFAPVDWSFPGVVTEPSGAQYFGGRFTFSVLEFSEVG